MLYYKYIYIYVQSIHILIYIYILYYTYVSRSNHESGSSRPSSMKFGPPSGRPRVWWCAQGAPGCAIHHLATAEGWNMGFICGFWTNSDSEHDLWNKLWIYLAWLWSQPFIFRRLTPFVGYPGGKLTEICGKPMATAQETNSYIHGLAIHNVQVLVHLVPVYRHPQNQTRNTAKCSSNLFSPLLHLLLVLVWGIAIPTASWLQAGSCTFGFHKPVQKLMSSLFFYESSNP